MIDGAVTYLCERDALAFIAGDEPAPDCGACLTTPLCH